MKVLYIEDHLSQRDIMQQRLEQWGCEVVVASDGFKGIETALKWRPDIILMDLRMPRMDGLTAIRKLKRRDSTLSDIPIVAISAWDAKGLRDATLRSGAVRFIKKPFESEQLIQIMKEVVAKEAVK